MDTQAPGPAAAEQEKLPRSLEDLFEPPLLIILQALLHDTAYTCVPYPGYPDPPTQEQGIGWYTYPGRNVVFFNPHHVRERGPVYFFPIFAHELGHHDPEVVKFQDACTTIGGNLTHMFGGLLPSKEIMQALDNVSADIFLESRVSRGVYHVFMRDLYRRALAQDVLPEEAFKSCHGDFTPGNFPWREAVSTDPSKRYIEHFHNGLLLMAKFETPPDGMFPEQVQEALREAAPLVQIISELDPAKSNTHQKLGAQVKIYELAAKLAKLDLEQMRSESGKDGKDGKRPMTMKELLDAYKDLFKQLMEGKIKIKIEVLNQPPSEANVLPPSLAIQALIADQLRKLLTGMGASLNALFSGQLGVPPEDFQDYMGTVERFKPYADALADILIEILLKDREQTVVTGRRDGFMVEPGQEVATYQQYLSGDMEPPTMLDMSVQRKPLTLQHALVFDTSGSMRRFNVGMKGLLATVIESTRRVHEKITAEPARYNWRPGERMPAQLELTRFADAPELILPMSSSLDLPTVIRKFQEMQKPGGGTCTHGVLEFEYERLTAAPDDHIVRILTLITDGQDGGPLLDAIVKKIVEDPRIYFLVLGIGPNAEVRKSIVDQYRKHLKPQSRYKVLAEGHPDVITGIQSVVNFFGMALRIERDRRDAMSGGARMSGY